MPIALYLPILTICTSLAQAPSQGLDPKAGDAWSGHPGGACWEVLAVGVPPIPLETCLGVARKVNALPDTPGVESRLVCMALVSADGEVPSQGGGSAPPGDDPNAEQHL